MSEEEKSEICMRCELTNCLQLFKKSEDSVDAGNELYVYSILGEKVMNKPDLGAHVCTNGRFLNASCFLSVPIFSDYRESFLCDVLIQATRDFKASLFLAFAGHYSQAMQVLRCAFENIISGVYYQSDLINLIEKGADNKAFSRLKRRFNEWKKEGRVNVSKSIEILRRVGFLSRDEEKDWKTLYSLLSRFVHTPEEYVTYVKHGGELKLKGDLVCPAATYFNEKQLTEWSGCFQSVFVVQLKTIAEFHSEVFDTETGRLAVSKCIEPQLREFGDKIQVTEEIRRILSTVQSSAMHGKSL